MTKNEIRKIFLADRMALSTQEVELQSEVISRRFLELFSNTFTNIDNDIVHTFLPIAHKNEVNTFLIVKELHKKFTNIKIAIPQVAPNSLDLQHVFIDSDIPFTNDTWGIPTPVITNNKNTNSPHQQLTPDNSLFITHHSRLVVVPLLAYDIRGYRVGYGKGFYDRFLAQCSADVVKVGLSFFDPVDTISDTDSYDIPLNYCVTPAKIWKF
jgi:5-formyltetrahydrofolate cyclo-ligase